MLIVLLGPPGAGKGTQAEALVKKLMLPHISTGEMFRAAIKNGTPMGLEAKIYMDQGRLVPDDIAVGLVRERIAQPDCKAGFLLDGFPRTIVQAEALDELLQNRGGLDAVFNISVPLENLVPRLTGRRMCQECGIIYHMLYNAPAKEGVCDSCGGELYQRDDDKEETVKNRLTVYEQQTAPVIDYYKRAGILHTVDGEQPIHAVQAEMGRILGQNWN